MAQAGNIQQALLALIHFGFLLGYFFDLEMNRYNM
jgi:hypothetical protein